jgi:AraC family transcriptional regulator of adaptative response / DNA-3-methyladenine glycosylase II
MDAQPGEIDAALSGDPALRPHVESAPGLRVPGAVEGFEMAVRAIVGQQVSVAGARTTLSGIVSRLGEPIAAPLGSVTHRFPTPSRLVAATDEDLRMPATRVQAIRTLSGMVLEGALDLDGGSDPAEATASLLTIRGVGPWTAAYVAMRALHDPDAFPEGDLGIRRGAASLGFSDGARLLRARAERWRPWRSYAAVHLWRANG